MNNQYFYIQESKNPYINNVAIKSAVQGSVLLIRALIKIHGTSELSRIKILHNLNSKVELNNKEIEYISDEKKKEKLRKDNAKLLVAIKLIKKMPLDQLKKYIAKESFKNGLFSLAKGILITIAITAIKHINHINKKKSKLF